MKTYLIIAALLLTTALGAQEYQLLNAKSSCKVEGTSTLHDWDMTSEQMAGKATLTVVDGKITGIEKLTFTVKVESMKSHKSGMDNNAYKAMKSDKYPTINYEFARVIEIIDQGDGQLIKTGGKLTIAGVTKSVYLDVLVRAGSEVSFTGSTKFKMTDYNIDPPVALMGTIKTGDEITIRFNVSYSK